MEILTAILVFMLVGGIARAAVIFFQESGKENTASLKRFESLEGYNQSFKRVALILQAIWLFWALFITNQHESSLLSLDTFIIFSGLSLPVITFYSIKWLVQSDIWPTWGLISGSCAQILAAVPLGDAIHGEDLTAMLIAMAIALNVFYMCANFPVMWNKLCDHNQRKPKAIRKTIIRTGAILLILLLGYSFWQDYRPSIKTTSPEYFSAIIKESDATNTLPKSNVQKWHE
ncbi:MAG: hypothetical protein ACRBCT_01265 [Alphaproteobacteria bacterium]